MSVADQFKNLFNKKSAPAAVDVLTREPDDNATLAMRGGQTLQAPTEAASGEESRLALGEDSSLQLGGVDEKVYLPGLGRAPVRQHQQVLTILLVLALAVLAAFAAFTFFRANQSTDQVSAAGSALTQSQRLAKSASQALLGSAQAFPEVRESSDVLAASMRGLKSGAAAAEGGADSSGATSADLAAVSQELQEDVDNLLPLAERAEKNASVIMGQQGILTQVGSALRTINRQSSDLLEVAETVSSLKLQQNAPSAELAASGQLVMLTQRIGKSANEFLTMEGVSPEAVFLLGKDLNSFKEIAEGLLNGSAELRLQAAKDPQIKERLETLLKGYEDTRAQAGSILGNLQGLVAAREAQVGIIADSEPLRRGIEELEGKLLNRANLSAASILSMAIPALLALLFAGGLVYVQRQEFIRRQLVVERQRQDAERQEQEAKRVNDGNQAAILRLMNELQTVAEGDLTQEATVTEDITGAIADSVNYTVEELRSLVGNVQNTVARVAQTTAAVEGTSTELLAASTEQLREIRETGQSVLDMAQRINRVSDQAQQSAQVARQSLQAAEQGLTAVQNAIGGMNSIRDQIQDTSKRIKRLGESSQEIGEITELISDITEQTNVLALNAAIQAASAGEAGRGFSVVAEEVQRLAERSGEATKQISALVKTIQTDTQDAVAAMERSTQGVVEGAKLSDNAGTALTEIDRVSRQLSDLIEQISQQTSSEAQSANQVAGNIQHIFAVTEQTGEGTRSTAQQVRELSRMAEELRQSVSRFKIA
jgi:twitching motility protein PilJ